MIRKYFISLIILTAIFCLLCAVCFGQSLSKITYDAGTNIEIQTGADECADTILINGTYTGTGTICMGALPVALSSFTFSINNNNVKLAWITEFEQNNSGFEIERKTPLNPPEGGTNVWIKIAFVTGNGTTNEAKQYTFEDKKLKTGTFKYRLKQIDYNGNYEYYGLESDVIIKPPAQFSCGQNYPNPSNPKSKIDYELPQNMKVTIKLYDILGREVMTLIDTEQDAGYYTAEFDGTNLASGIYFYRIKAGTFVNIKKLVLVK